MACPPDRLPLQVALPTPGQRLDERDLCLMVVHANYDYIATRLLWFSGLTELAFFHMQQAVEKYLKAFLIARGRDFSRRTHDLGDLCRKCAEVDGWFAQPPWPEWCKRLAYFSEVGRYPQERFGGWGFNSGVLDYLDEFAYTVRERMPLPENCEDVLGDLCRGQGWIVEWLGKTHWNMGFLDAFFVSNNYFRHQADGRHG